MRDDYFLARAGKLLSLAERFVTEVVAVGRDDPRRWRVTALAVLPGLRRLVVEIEAAVSSDQDPSAGGAS